MDLAKKVGKNLKAARKACGLTQKEVTGKMLMTQQQYSRFENGVFELNYSQITALCALFEICPNELFDGCRPNTENSPRKRTSADDILKKSPSQP